MDFYTAFRALDMLNESVAHDSYKQALADIEQLETEIAALEAEIADGWKKDYKAQLAAAEDEVWKINKDLYDVLKSYRTKYYTEFDQDGDPTSFDFHINEKEQKSLAVVEDAIRNRLAIAEATLNKLRNQLKQDHAKAFAIQSRDVRSKSAARDTRKKDKEALIQTIIAEERPELEKLITTLQSSFEVVPDWKHMTVNKNKIILSLIVPGSTYCVDPDSDIDYDDEDASIDVGKIDETIRDSVLEDGYFYDLASSLGISDAAIDNAASGELLEIPGSDWRLDTDFDLEYDEPVVHSTEYTPATHWEPEEFDIDYDEEVDWKIIYYLVKEI